MDSNRFQFREPYVSPRILEKAENNRRLHDAFVAALEQYKPDVGNAFFVMHQIEDMLLNGELDYQDNEAPDSDG